MKMESLKELECQKSKVEGQKSLRSDESVKVAIKREQRKVYLAMPSESNFMSEANNRLIDQSKSAPELSYEERKEQQRKIKKAERLVELCEVAISETEKSIFAIEEKLSTGDTSPELLTQYDQLKQQLEKEMTEWEEATEAYENLKES